MIINNNHIKVRRFSSNEMKLLFDDYLPLAKLGEVTIFYTGEESLFELFLIIKLLKDKGIQVKLIMAYLPYQRMDHDNGYEAHTLKYVAEIMNSFELKELYVCEPHCNLNLFNNAKAISLVDAIYKYVTKQIDFDEDKDYLVFTDKGSKNRYSHLGKNHIYFEKSRDKLTGLIAEHKMIGKIEDGRKILLIDDIISSGDTIINCTKLLGNKKINIIAGHFEKNKYNLRIFDLKNVEGVYTSDSLTKRKVNKKLKLFKVKKLIDLGGQNE